MLKRSSNCTIVTNIVSQKNTFPFHPPSCEITCLDFKALQDRFFILEICFCEKFIVVDHFLEFLQESFKNSNNSLENILSSAVIILFWKRLCNRKGQIKSNCSHLANTCHPTSCNTLY